MIVADTSALMAVLLVEAEADAFVATLGRSERIIMGAPTLFESLMVSGQRRPGGQGLARRLIDSFGIEVAAWTDAYAQLAHDAFLRYGKGRHPAGLNFGDCMSYALAKSLDAPLLYKGGDFALTDIVSAV